MGKKLLMVFAVLAWAAVTFAGENIAAVVNGAQITERDISEAVDRMIPKATFHGTLSDERRAEFRDKALEDLITFELQYQDGVSRGITPDQGQVKDQMKLIRASFGSSRDYKDWLRRVDLTEDQLREKVRRALVVQAAVTRTVTEPSRVSDASLLEYYTQNIEKFRQPESIRLRLISTKDEKKAKNILAKLKEGDDFGNMAARMSEDDYRVRGGDIGYVHRGRIYPALEEAAFKLNPGQMSDLILTEQTWFLLKVEDRRPEQTVPFEQARDKLRSDLEKKRASELMETWVSSLRAKAKIELRESRQGRTDRKQ